VFTVVEHDQDVLRPEEAAEHLDQLDPRRLQGAAGAGHRARAIGLGADPGQLDPTTSLNSPTRSVTTASARRGLPAPPAPAIVTDRVCSSRTLNSARSPMRPINPVRPGSFTDYGNERDERMHRLRIGARIATDLRATFAPSGATRRRVHTELLASYPILGGPILAGLLGPEQLPAESFEQRTIDRILAVT
jgi:hypothetical protein